MRRVSFHRAVYFLAYALIFLSVHVGAQTPQQSGPALPSSLRWYANIARSRGQTSLELASTETHDYSPPLAESLQKDLLIKGTVLSRFVDASDGFRVYRWYRVRVLSQGPSKTTVSASEHASVPPSLRGGSGVNEILVRVSGGTTVIDGISITQPGPAALNLNQDYAFFLERTSSGFYTLGFATTPVALNADGSFNLPPVGGRLFIRQLRAYRSYQDVQQLAMRSK